MSDIKGINTMIYLSNALTQASSTLIQKSMLWFAAIKLMAIGLSLSICMVAHAGSGSPESQGKMLTLYSPAPANVLLNDYNHELASRLTSCGVPTEITLVPLPESINQISALDESVKQEHLPIVTPVDFLPAVHQTGPDWHAYSLRNDDLKFVTSLYDVSFGILSFSEDIQTAEDLAGKRIATPPRPGSVRVLTELLLRDGWGLIDAVEMIDIPPQNLKDAIESGAVDAISWNLMTETPMGFEPWFPWQLDIQSSHWISIDEESIQAINNANTLKVSGTRVSAYALGGQPEDITPPVNLLSFKQGLAAWSGTEEAVVLSILECIQANADLPGLPNSITEMADWPGLRPELIHPTALKFYGLDSKGEL